MPAIDDAGPARRGARKLYGGFDRFGTRIREADLVEIGRQREESFGQNAGQRRDIHLDQVGQFAVEDSLERLADDRMIAADREDTEPAQQVEVLRSTPIIEIGPLTSAEVDVVANRSEYPHHLLIEMAGVHRVAVGGSG